MGFVLVAIMGLASAATAAETRIALVIGNSEYSSGPLPNPANDAKMMGDTLTSLGFEVILRRNADQNTMKRAIQEFGARLEKGGPGAVGLFYYAGHGVQLNGRNYLIPTTAQIDREGDVEIEAVSADWVIEQMRFARNRLNIVILDACRNNPFTRSMRSVDHGLATMDAPAGILIAYSTAPGSVAMDGNGRNSPYTEALSQAMRDLHEPVEQVFKHVRVGVMGATANKQVPWESSSLTGDFYFAPPAEISSVQPANRQVPSAQAAAGGTGQASAGQAPSTRGGGTESGSGGLGAMLANFFGGSGKSAPEPPRPAAAPNQEPAAAAAGNVAGAGSSAAGAGNGAGAGSVPSAAAGPPPAGYVSGSGSLALLQLLGVQAAEIDAAHNYPVATVRQLVESSPRHVTVGNTQKQIQAALSMCRHYAANCQLAMFSDEVLRSATLMPLELDPLPVSVQAFRVFVEATHYRTEAETNGFAYAHDDVQSVSGGSWRNGVKGHVAADDTAVVGVSFQDAAAYCHYTGERLPTETEWEYVARGPERHTFPWGENLSPAMNAGLTPPRVSEGPAQGIGGRYRGLAGNVWQWVDTKVEGRRVLKGASWLETNPTFKRAATRRYELPDKADEDSGIRCAKGASRWPDADVWMAGLK